MYVDDHATHNCANDALTWMLVGDGELISTEKKGTCSSRVGVEGVVQRHKEHGTLRNFCACIKKVTIQDKRV